MRRLFLVCATAAGVLSGCSGDHAYLPTPPLIQPQDTAPSWSPDGTQIAYIHFAPDLADTVEPSGLYVTDAAGTIKRLVLAGYAQSVDWSPDSRSLVFSDPSGLYVIASTGDSMRSLYVGGSFPSWSPDGSRIAFSAGGSLWMVDAFGNGLVAIAIDVPGEKRDPDWAPDGNRLVALAPHPTSGEEVYVTRRDGTGLARLTTDSNEDRSPIWSPAGNLIVWNRWGLDRYGRLHPELWSMDTLGSQKHRIVDALSAPSFNPTGASIVFSSQALGGIRLFVINVDGSGLRQLTH